MQVLGPFFDRASENPKRKEDKSHGEQKESRLLHC